MKILLGSNGLASLGNVNQGAAEAAAPVAERSLICELGQTSRLSVDRWRSAPMIKPKLDWRVAQKESGPGISAGAALVCCLLVF